MRTNKAYFVPFLMKKFGILKALSKILAKKNFNQTIHQRSSISNGNNNTLPLKFLTYFELY